MADNIDRTIVGWRAWYTGGRVFDSDTTAWEDLPAEGALVFMLYCRSRPYMRGMSGVTLYWCEETPEGIVYACDNVQDAILPDDDRLVKRGKWVTDQEFWDVQMAVRAATNAPGDTEAQRIG